MLGAGCLAGIGFTMSIFISGLALEGDLLDDGKIGALVGSMISAVLGCALLLMFMPVKSKATTGNLKRQAGGKELPGTKASVEKDRWRAEERWRDDGGQSSYEKVKF